MDDLRYRRLVRLAITLTVAWIGWTVFDSDFQESAPGAHELAAAGKYLEDGNLSEALVAFESARTFAPDNIGALRGQAQTLMRMGINADRAALILAQAEESIAAAHKQKQATKYFQRALLIYDTTIKQEERRGITDANRVALSVSYANRGILKDQMGRYSGAISDYEHSMSIETSAADGPGWLTRFMRNQPERPATIADRAQYLRQQMTMSGDVRILRIPEADAEQHAYKLN